jgi:hypothetical protein
LAERLRPEAVEQEEHAHAAPRAVGEHAGHRVGHRRRAARSTSARSTVRRQVRRSRQRQRVGAVAVLEHLHAVPDCTAVPVYSSIGAHEQRVGRRGRPRTGRPRAITYSIGRAARAREHADEGEQHDGHAESTSPARLSPLLEHGERECIGWASRAVGAGERRSARRVADPGATCDIRRGLARPCTCAAPLPAACAPPPSRRPGASPPPAAARPAAAPSRGRGAARRAPHAADGGAGDEPPAPASGAGGPALAWGPVLALVLATVAGHVAVNVVSPYGIHRDELLYLAMGRHLRLWAMDFPPFIALLAEVTRMLLGDALWAIRLGPAVAHGTLVFLAA